MTTVYYDNYLEKNKKNKICKIISEKVKKKNNLAKKIKQILK
jgi:hypothetical protein